MGTDGEITRKYRPDNSLWGYVSGGLAGYLLTPIYIYSQDKFFYLVCFYTSVHLFLIFRSTFSTPGNTVTALENLPSQHGIYKILCSEILENFELAKAALRRLWAQ